MSRESRGLLIAAVVSVLVPVQAAAQSAPARGAVTVSLSVRIVDAGAPERGIGAANVKVLDPAGKVLAQGITDAAGKFVAPALSQTQVAIEYEKFGWIQLPERRPLEGFQALNPGENSMEGDLIRFPTSTERALNADEQAYYTRVAQVMSDRAKKAPERTQKLLIEQQWQRVLELPAEAQGEVAGELLKVRPPGLFAIEKDLHRVQGIGRIIG